MQYGAAFSVLAFLFLALSVSPFQQLIWTEAYVDQNIKQRTTSRSKIITQNIYF